MSVFLEYSLPLQTVVNNFLLHKVYTYQTIKYIFRRNKCYNNKRKDGCNWKPIMKVFTCFRTRTGLRESDNINQMTTVYVITYSSLYCVTNYY